MLKPTAQLLTSICLITFIGLNIFLANAQDIQRVEISGKIIVDSPDVEGVTVFNATSNKGTITDAEGKFSILVALNDRLQISALQFEILKLLSPKTL